MSTSIFRVALMLMLVSSLGGAAMTVNDQPPAPAVQRLSLVGSSTMGPLMREVARRYMRLHPEMHIEVAMGGSGRGLRAAREGSADIGMVARALGEGEGELQGIPIARDGVAVVVHAGNPVTGLSRQQLAAIYQGQIGDWRALGGKDLPLTVLAGPADAGATELFAHYLRLDYARLRPARSIAANADRLAAVAADPGAIVFASVGEAERAQRAGLAVRLLSVDGIAASTANVGNGSYPIARPLSLAWRGTASRPVRGFMEFCLSSQITDLIVGYDFVPYLD